MRCKLINKMTKEQTPIDETVTISKKEYELLLKSVEWLECLEAAGVDNWEGIDHAVSLRDEE